MAWVSDPELLWVWCRPAATTLIRPLAEELPYATLAALKRQKQKTKTKKKRERECNKDEINDHESQLFYQSALTADENGS